MKYLSKYIRSFKKAFWESYYAELRKQDIRTVWRICRKDAVDIRYARQAFYYYAMSKKHWQILDHNEMINIIWKDLK